MTITRRWQSGFETNGTSIGGELTALDGATYSTTKKTGTYSLETSSSETPYVSIPATRQIRVGGHLKLQSGGASINPHFIGIRSSANPLVGVKEIAGAVSLALIIGVTQQDSFSFAVEAADFSHFGLDVKIDSSAGWAVLYINGIEQMRFEGNTGNEDINTVKFSSNGITCFDDVFIDDTTGQGAAAPVPDRRFYAVTPNAIGSYSQGTSSGSAASSHYMYVDDRPHNSDTDYIILDAVDQKETYNMTTVCPPTGFTFAAVIPFVYAKKTDAEVATELALLMRSSGSTDLEGSACNLGTSYGFQWERFTTAPSGGAWTQADIDGIEIGYQGEGTF
jgi:hypothetical protein